MYKVSIPINAELINDATLPVYYNYICNAKVHRVFLFGLDMNISCDEWGDIYENINRAVQFFKGKNLEVGIWINSFGHGCTLSHELKTNNTSVYTPIEDVYGNISDGSHCPMDEGFRNLFAENIKKIAMMHPHIIMLDDDFRLNVREGMYMSCFCPLHLERYYGILGEKPPRELLEELIFSSGANKYRNAYMDMMADTLINFAKSVRKAIDSVDCQIRAGACVCFDNLDYCGTDIIEIARAFAGDTKPFLRTIGAPYWSENIIDVIENTRMQISYCKGTDIEVFAEGDTYPRPRYAVSSNRLELFDMCLMVNGGADGILKYMFDYTQKPDYETGYIDRHIKNLSLKNDIQSIFKDKTPVGVYAVNTLHKIRNAYIDKPKKGEIAGKLINSYKSSARNLLAKNSIPTSYEYSGYPLLICGEDARYVSEDMLKKGAVLDAVAAMILKDKGIDTGIVSAIECDFEGESFNGDIIKISQGSLMKIKCKPGVRITGSFIPGDFPASYMYENEYGIRFFVLAYDLYGSNNGDCYEFCDNDNIDYMNNYYRQQQLVDALEWIGRKKLPVVCKKNPNLYFLTSVSGSGMSVLMMNISTDSVISPEIMLDKKYNRVDFVNCSGKLINDRVELDDLPPYGIADFELTE